MASKREENQALADQLRGKVLSIGSTAAIAGEKYLVAGAQRGCAGLCDPFHFAWDVLVLS